MQDANLLRHQSNMTSLVILKALSNDVLLCRKIKANSCDKNLIVDSKSYSFLILRYQITLNN